MTEGETEDDQKPLPTSRIAPALQSSTSKVLPSLFFALRMLSIVPATLGTLFHLHHLYHPPPITRQNPNGRVEYAVTILWTIVTAHQCLSLTTGLLHRWRIYYSTLPTLIRLLALQCAILWPLTHATLNILNHAKRPLICWAVIGTTTCISKAIELWVTSNLRPARKGEKAWHSVIGVAGWVLGEEPVREGVSYEMAKGKIRRWNWERVLRHCVAPPCAIYFVMAWALVLKGEFE
ncbi:hypothetical protein FRB94_008077 [Tulasnella sp. JGI-2019a]|nr:hypothetical protein FRB94_008077 [Tulasnella sp. JGI-2019a]